MSVCLSCGSGDGRPICIPGFPGGEHRSLVPGMKEKHAETWLHLYFPVTLIKHLNILEPFSPYAKQAQ